MDTRSCMATPYGTVTLVGNTGYKTVKIKVESYERLKKTLEQVIQYGWSKIRAVRQDQPTLANLVDEAVSRLDRDSRK